MDVMRCDTCGEPSTTYVNGRPFCREHFREGLVREARLEAFKSGADSETIRRTGEFMAQEFDRMMGEAFDE